MPATRARPEARLERDSDSDFGEYQIKREETILRREIVVALGGEPDVLVMVNEVNAVTKMSRLVTDKRRAWSALLPEERYGLGIGSPDLVLVVRGRFLGLEIKRPKTADHAAGQLSKEQRDWHDSAHARGVDVRMVRSVEEARRAVEEVRRGG